MIAMGFEAKTTGKRIADIRGKNNMSQEKLAETLSKSVSLISLYEGGHRVPRCGGKDSNPSSLYGRPAPLRCFRPDKLHRGYMRDTV